MGVDIAWATIKVLIAMKNTGQTAWYGPIRLGSLATNELTWHFGPAGGYSNNPGDQRVYLDQVVLPGGSHVFEFTIDLPKTPGTYRFGSQMVHDGVTWFGQKINMKIVVSAGLPPADIGDEEACAQLVVDAYEAGINYFDTAPSYFEGRSEERFGLAFREMKATRAARPFYVTTKSSKADPDGIRRDLEASLTRLGLDRVDFFHVWWVVRPETYFERKARGALDAFTRLKEEGLIGHVVLSSHMSGDESADVLADYPFDGVLVGYSALNAAYRERTLEVAAAGGRGVVVMNPLAGGEIPRHAERFAFLSCRPDETVVEGALRFLLHDPRITSVLVGFSNRRELDEALSAVTGFDPDETLDRQAIFDAAAAGFDALCTGCAYCNACPQEIPLPRLMLALNDRLFSDDPKKVEDTLRFGHGLPPEKVRPLVARCDACGWCESVCTQKLPIIARFDDVVAALDSASPRPIKG